MKKTDPNRIKARNKAVAKIVLKTIGIAALVGGVLVFPGIGPMIKWVDDMVAEHKRESRLAFYRMKKQGMLKIDSRGNGMKIVLTKKGWYRFKRYHLADLKIQKPSGWDGRWRMVMFDVPEASKPKRDILRKRLLKLGFISLQKSVFIQPYPCDELVAALRNYYDLKPGQLYLFETIVREGEKELRKHFKI